MDYAIAFKAFNKLLTKANTFQAVTTFFLIQESYHTWYW